MGNFYKHIPRGIPAYAEALGVLSPEEEALIEEKEDGRLVFRRPDRGLINRSRQQTVKKKPQAVKSRQVNPPPKTVSASTARKKNPSQTRRDANSTSLGGKNRGTAPSRRGQSGDPKLRVNLDIYPRWPKHLKVHQHVPDGKFYWNSSQVDLFISSRQSGRGISGHAVRSELQGKRVCNVNLLQWLINNQQYIPIWWRRNARKIFFWGTIYRDPNGRSCVLYITSRSKRWIIGVQKLGEIFTSWDHAAIRI